jgi:hypothetical protein
MPLDHAARAACNNVLCFMPVLLKPENNVKNTILGDFDLAFGEKIGDGPEKYLMFIEKYLMFIEKYLMFTEKYLMFTEKYLMFTENVPNVY